MSGDFFPSVVFVDHLDLMRLKDWKGRPGDPAYWRYIVDGLRS